MRPYYARMRVRLIRKLASEINGVDLSTCDVGSVVDLPEPKGQILVAEEWAIPERRTGGPGEIIAFRRQTDPGHTRDRDDASHVS